MKRSHGSPESQFERRGREAPAEPCKLALEALEASVLPIMVTDADTRILLVNPAFTDVTGYTAQEVRGATPRILQSGRHSTAFYERLWEELATADHWQGEIWNRRKNGELYPEWLTISSVKGAGDEIRYYVGVFSDISSRKRDEEQLKQLAYRDYLTGLPNRALLHDRIEQALGASRRQCSALAVLFIDLDGFKSINDAYGHTFGDVALQIIAECLQMNLRSSDTVARVGGDEFVVLLPEINDPADAGRIARKILRSLDAGLVIRGHEVRPGASIGISTCPPDGGSARALIEAADRAMYEIKKSGKCGYRFHSVVGSAGGTGDAHPGFMRDASRVWTLERAEGRGRPSRKFSRAGESRHPR